MDISKEIKRLFHTDPVSYCERLRLVHVELDISQDSIADWNDISVFLNFFPSRDLITITYSDGLDSYYQFNRNSISLDDYVGKTKEFEYAENVHVELDVQKNIQNDVLSVYNFTALVQELTSLDLLQVMAEFNSILLDQNQIHFLLIGGGSSFSSQVLSFSSDENYTIDQIDRGQKLLRCQENSSFLNAAQFELLPDDFYLIQNYNDNPLTDLFEKITTFLSIAYLSSNCAIENRSIINVQIVGQRSLFFKYKIEEIKNNKNIFNIYNWVYQDERAIDKVLLARNVISLQCKFCDLLEIDDKAFPAIVSNFNLYLRKDLAAYLDVKNKLAEFISNVLSQLITSSSQFVRHFISNIIAILGFLFSIVLSNIVNQMPLTNIFTREITIILDCVFAGSVLYGFFCRQIALNKMHDVEMRYNELKNSYSDLFDDTDKKNIFNDDTLWIKEKKKFRKTIRIYIILWLIVMIIAFFVLEYISVKPIILKPNLNIPVFTENDITDFCRL